MCRVEDEGAVVVVEELDHSRLLRANLRVLRRSNAAALASAHYNQNGENGCALLN